MKKTIIAYKGFDKDLKCRDFQYEIGKSYEHTGAVSICNSGFHACEYPLDVLGYYNLDGNRFAIVEQSGDMQDHKKEDSKICSSKIHIQAELTIPQLIKASVDWHFDGWFKKAKKDGKTAASKPLSNLAASGDDSKLAASGYGSKLAASGGGSNLAASGDYSNLAASGDDSKLAASGYGSKLAASGGGSNVIVSAEKNIMVKGSLNTLICLTHYVNDKPVKFVTGKIGENGLKADTWYSLNANGELAEGV